jgi:hypothetical protein
MEDHTNLSPPAADPKHVAAAASQVERRIGGGRARATPGGRGRWIHERRQIVACRQADRRRHLQYARAHQTAFECKSRAAREFCHCAPSFHAFYLGLCSSIPPHSNECAGVVFELLRTDKDKKVAIKFAKAWKLVGAERNPAISAQFAALHAEFQTVRLISGARMFDSCCAVWHFDLYRSKSSSAPPTDS